MIIKSIVVHKYPVVAVQDRRPVVPGWITTQAEYNDWMDTLPFQVGDMLTMSPAQNDVTDPWMVHMFCQLETDITKAMTTDLKMPKAMLMVQVATMPTGGLPNWIRWDTPQGYRKVTDKEKKQLFKSDEEYDRVQNHCRELARQYCCN